MFLKLSKFINPQIIFCKMLFLVFCVCIILPASSFAVRLGDYNITNKLNNPSPVITDESDKGIADGPLQWWQTGAKYQVHASSFKDSNGDWVGDLKGIEEETYHFKDLGVAAVCLSPIYKSPMVYRNFGYDISNYTDVADIFGTMGDFESLKSTLHSFGLKLVLDFVPNHTSDQCVWFDKSVKKIDPYTNYYVWKDPKGWINNKPIPPNNWISVFSGGPVWQYNEERKQFYLHNFSTKQPNLNYRCKELVEETKNVLRFWLDKGIDGFRVETVPYLVETKDFPDEPLSNLPKPSTKTESDLVNHIYTMDNLESFQIVEEFKNTIKDYSDKDNKSRVMITEANENFNHIMERRNMEYGKREESDINIRSIRIGNRPIITQTIEDNRSTCIKAVINGIVVYSSAGISSNSNLSHGANSGAVTMTILGNYNGKIYISMADGNYAGGAVTMTINDNRNTKINIIMKGGYQSSSAVTVTVNNRVNKNMTYSYPSTSGAITVTLNGNTGSTINVRIG